MKKTIEIKRTAHYYLQIPTKPIGQILFILHGYAQLASDFIQEFDFLKDSNTLVVAPEALSKFYNKERKAVANWMTSHERDDEIKDYINYLKAIEVELMKKHPTALKKVLGFSQGVSTLFRWSIKSEYKTNSIYACSGSIPTELNKISLGLIKSTPINYYYGTKDGLLPIDKAKRQISFLEQIGLDVHPIAFEGGHEISKNTKSDLT